MLSSERGSGAAPLVFPKVKRLIHTQRRRFYKPSDKNGLMEPPTPG